MSISRSSTTISSTHDECVANDLLLNDSGQSTCSAHLFTQYVDTGLCSEAKDVFVRGCLSADHSESDIRQLRFQSLFTHAGHPDNRRSKMTRTSGSSADTSGLKARTRTGRSSPCPWQRLLPSTIGFLRSTVAIRRAWSFAVLRNQLANAMVGLCEGECCGRWQP